MVSAEDIRSKQVDNFVIELEPHWQPGGFLIVALPEEPGIAKNPANLRPRITDLVGRK
jgi:hypothetical protein